MKVSRGTFLVIVRIVLGGVFLYAGFAKITDPTAFAGSIAAYRILPYFGNYLVAAVLPWVEVLCGLLLIVDYRTRGAAAIVALPENPWTPVPVPNVWPTTAGLPPEKLEPYMAVFELLLAETPTFEALLAYTPVPSVESPLTPTADESWFAEP